MTQNEANPWDVISLQVFSYFCCPECDFRDRNYDIFKSHAVSKHDRSKEHQNQWQKSANETCNDDYSTTSDEEKTSGLKCPNCGKEYKSQTTLDNHLKKVHQPKEINFNDFGDRERGYVCEKCGQSFQGTNKKAYAWHIRNGHRDSVSCDKCDRTFTNDLYLYHHYRKL